MEIPDPYLIPEPYITKQDIESKYCSIIGCKNKPLWKISKLWLFDGKIVDVAYVCLIHKECVSVFIDNSVGDIQ